MTQLELSAALLRTMKIFEEEKEKSDKNLEKAIFAALQAFCNILSIEVLKFEEKK